MINKSHRDFEEIISAFVEYLRKLNLKQLWKKFTTPDNNEYPLVIIFEYNFAEEEISFKIKCTVQAFPLVELDKINYDTQTIIMSIIKTTTIEELVEAFISQNIVFKHGKGYKTKNKQIQSSLKRILTPEFIKSIT